MNIADRLKIETHESFTLVIMDYDHRDGPSIIELQKLFLNNIRNDHPGKVRLLEIVRHVKLNQLVFDELPKYLDSLSKVVDRYAAVGGVAEVLSSRMKEHFEVVTFASIEKALDYLRNG